MGYLDNRTITVDAILTKKGRQLLASGKQFFNITKFALADDEVDYHLWNPYHPSGSNYYGVAIEQMPVLEPTADETQVMRYKLVSLDKSTVKIPVVSVYPTTITFSAGQEVVITPNTVYSGNTGGVNLNSQFGYTCILHNSDVAYLTVTDAAPSAGEGINATEEAVRVLNAIASSGFGNTETYKRLVAQFSSQQQMLAGALGLQGGGAGIFLGDSETAKSVFATGLKFKLTAKSITSKSNLQTTVTVIGNETGGSATLSITNKRIKVEER